MSKKSPKRIRLTDAQRASIAEYATLQFSLDEVAVMMGLDYDRLEASAEADRIFWENRLKSQAYLRKAIIESAASGDAQAQKLVVEWAKISNM